MTYRRQTSVTCNLRVRSYPGCKGPTADHGLAVCGSGQAAPQLLVVALAVLVPQLVVLEHAPTEILERLSWVSPVHVCI